MKHTIMICAALFLFSLPAAAVTGIDIGVKGGVVRSFDQPGLSLSSYDLHSLNMIGGQMFISTLPVVDVIIALDYSWRNETYEIAGENLEFDARDFVVSASVVYPITGIPVVQPYVGGGVANHALSYNYLRPVSLSLEDNGVTVPESSTAFGIHGIIGAKLALPASPLGLFLEGRFNRVDGPGDANTYNTWSGGLFFSLP